MAVANPVDSYQLSVSDYSRVVPLGLPVISLKKNPDTPAAIQTITVGSTTQGDCASTC
jgi:hypothetical protein